MAEQPPRVFIEGVELSGFKSIAETRLDLGPINVLIGANGAGKSNFASFFQMLAASLGGELDDHVSQRGGAGAFLHHGAKTTRQIHCALRVRTESGKGSLYQKLMFRAPDTLAYARTHLPAPRGQGGLNPPTVKPSPFAPPGLCSVLADEGTPPEVVFEGVRDGIGVYHFHDTSLDGPLRKSIYVSDNQRLHRDGANLAAMLYLYQQLERQQKQEQPRKKYLGTAYSRIKAMVRKCFPEFEDFVLEPERLDGNRIILKWRQRQSDYLFGPHQLSDGTLRAMALATLLLQPEKDLPNLIVIDEPELGLHPLAIELVAGMVRAVSLKCQVILATQSTTLVDHFEPEEIVVAEVARGASQFRRLDREDLTDWLGTYRVSELWQKNVIGGGPLP